MVYDYRLWIFEDSEDKWWMFMDLEFWPWKMSINQSNQKGCLDLKNESFYDFS